MSYLVLLAHAHSWTNSSGTRNSLTPNTVQEDHMCHPHVCNHPVGPKEKSLLIPAMGRDLRFSTCARGFLHSFIQVLEGIADHQRDRIFCCFLHFLSLLQGLHSAWHYSSAHTRVKSGVGSSYTGTEKHIVTAVVWYMSMAEAARTMK